VILKFLAPYLLPAGGALLVFALLFGGAQTWRMNRAKASLAELQTVIANERAAANAAALVADKEFRETERQWIEAVQDGQKAIDQAKREFTAAVATVRAAASADAAILRKRIDAASSGETSAGAAPSGGGIAAACGDVLAEALSVASEHTVAAERHADTVRSLLRSWPSAN
jgi:hypothetical protein